MLVWKSGAKLAVRELQAEIDFLRCESEFQRNAHLEIVSVYEARIADLQKLVFIPRSAPTPEVLEADSVMNASEKPFKMSEEEFNKMMEGQREIDLLVSGNYDQDLVS